MSLNFRLHGFTSHGDFRADRLQWCVAGANSAHIRQSMPVSGLASQVQVLNLLQDLPFSFGNGHL